MTSSTPTRRTFPTSIVVGHRGHGAVCDAILGSVASSTVHHSRRSVLVAVPPTT